MVYGKKAHSIEGFISCPFYHLIFVHSFSMISGVTRGVGGAGGQSAPPETSDQEISADLPGKKRQGKMEKGGGKWRRNEVNCKREAEK